MRDHHNGLFRSYFTPSSMDTLSYVYNGFLSLSLKRRCALVFCSLAGFIFICIMKRESLLWFAAATAGAAPVLEHGQGSDFQGLRFDLDGKFKISVFEDLHYGEGMC